MGGVVSYLSMGIQLERKIVHPLYFIGINITDSEALGVFKMPFSGFLK